MTAAALLVRGFSPKTLVNAGYTEAELREAGLDEQTIASAMIPDDDGPDRSRANLAGSIAVTLALLVVLCIALAVWWRRGTGIALLQRNPNSLTNPMYMDGVDVCEGGGGGGGGNAENDENDGTDVQADPNQAAVYDENGGTYVEADPNQPAVYDENGGTYVQADPNQPAVYDENGGTYVQADPNQPAVYDENGGSVLIPKCTRPTPSGAGTCKNNAVRGTLFCKGHTCTAHGCTAGKSGKASACPAHAPGTSATEEYDVGVVVKCARPSPSGGSCKNNAVRGTLFCNGHTCSAPGCTAGKSGREAACPAHTTVGTGAAAIGAAAKPPLLQLDSDNYVYGVSANKPHTAEYAVPFGVCKEPPVALGSMSRRGNRARASGRYGFSGGNGGKGGNDSSGGSSGGSSNVGTAPRGLTRAGSIYSGFNVEQNEEV